MERKYGLLHAAAVAEQQSKAGRGDARREKRADREVWRDQAAAIGWRHGTVLEGAPAPALTDTERCETAYAFAAERLTEEFRTAAVLDRDKLDLWAARGEAGFAALGDADIHHENAIEEPGRRWRTPGAPSVTARAGRVSQVPLRKR